MPRIPSILILILLGPLVLFADAPTEANVKKWIEQLNAPSFAVRENAKKRLINAGPVAIGPLAEQLSISGVEASLLGLTVLRELALQYDGSAIKAEQAIRDLAANQVTGTSRRAASILRSLSNMRSSRALKILRRLGAKIRFTGESNNERRLRNSVVFISLGESWHGSIDDLAFLDWLAEYRGIHITFEGTRFTDQWLETVSTIEKIVSLKLSRTDVTSTGIRHIEAMANLRGAELLYCKLNDDCLKYFDREPSLSFFSVFGSGISKIAFEAFSAKHQECNTRYGRGGFLGVAGTAYSNGLVAGCVIQTVTGNQAAEKAGIREGDIITKYDGKPVTTFVPIRRIATAGGGRSAEEQPQASLAELIGQDAPGDRVQVTVVRQGLELVHDVVLGEWP